MVYALQHVVVRNNHHTKEPLAGVSLLSYPQSVAPTGLIDDAYDKHCLQIRGLQLSTLVVETIQLPNWTTLLWHMHLVMHHHCLTQEFKQYWS